VNEAATKRVREGGGATRNPKRARTGKVRRPPKTS